MSSTNGTRRHVTAPETGRTRAVDAATMVVVLVTLTPLLAIPLGVSWRVLRWSAGL